MKNRYSESETKAESWYNMKILIKFSSLIIFEDRKTHKNLKTQYKSADPNNPQFAHDTPLLLISLH